MLEVEGPVAAKGLSRSLVVDVVSAPTPGRTAGWSERDRLDFARLMLKYVDSLARLSAPQES